MPEVIIFDYGVGNLFSLKNALETVGLTVKISQSLKKPNSVDALALPGVGSFPAALIKIEPVRETIRLLAANNTPILGICLGMQLFFEKSEEGKGQGLSFFKGKNIRLSPSAKIPHMGWNTIRIIKQNEILNNVPHNSYVYFVHSLYPVPKEKRIIATETEYNEVFASMVAHKNIFGTQFHPEKSGEVGLKILKNFAKIVKR